MHSQNPEALFGKWLDNQLSDAQREQFEQLCLQDPEFAAQVEMATQLSMDAEQFERVSLPQWDKNATFNHSPDKPWWQWPALPALPALSLATSMCAIFMVTVGMRFEVSDGRVAVEFGHGPDQQEIAALVEDKLANYRDANQTLFTQYVDALAKQQQENSAQLTQYLLSSSRKERREDFAELVKFINEQRSDDQRFYARQLNNLQQEIEALETGYSGPQTPLELTNE